MVEVIWSNRAASQLERVITFLAEEQSPSVARTVLERILDRTRSLTEHPEMGQKEPLLAHKISEYRYLIVWSYKVIYKKEKERVIISRIFHTSRDPGKLKGI